MPQWLFLKGLIVDSEEKKACTKKKQAEGTWYGPPYYWQGIYAGKSEQRAYDQ